MNNFDKEEQDHISLMKMVTQKIQATKPFVLKGGTALMIAYGLDRFSEDLDFDVYANLKISHKANLSSMLKNIKSNNFIVNDVAIRKDTDSVNRYRINYQNSLGNEASLKIEISYRTPLNQEEAILKNGIYVLPIEKIAEFKIHSVLDINSDSRTKARDLYDTYFIIRHYPNSVSDEQISNLLNLNMDTLEARYEDSFIEDRILSNNKDLAVILLELSETTEQIAKDRNLKKYEFNNNPQLEYLKEKLTTTHLQNLKEKLTTTHLQKSYPTLSTSDLQGIELFKNHMLEQYPSPKVQEAILKQLLDKIPAIATGEITLPNLQEYLRQKEIERN